MESPSFSYGKVPSYGYVDDDRECEKDDSNEEEVYGKLEDDDKQKEVEFKNPRSKFVDSIYVEDLWFAAKFWSEHEEQIVKTKKRSELK